jgi:hypothetical protein
LEPVGEWVRLESPPTAAAAAASHDPKFVSRHCGIRLVPGWGESGGVERNTCSPTPRVCGHEERSKEGLEVSLGEEEDFCAVTVTLDRGISVDTVNSSDSSSAPHGSPLRLVLHEFLLPEILPRE